MKKKTRFIRSERRSFLKGAAVAGGAAVVAPTVVASEQPVADPVASAGRGADVGYEENDYIRNYYDRARF
jgi:hypothetical protein